MPTCYNGMYPPTTKGWEDMDEGKRPVQIQLEEEAFRVLKIHAAAMDTTANELIADLARKEAEALKGLNPLSIEP